MQIIYKTKWKDEINWRRTIRQLVITDHQQMMNPWEVIDLLKRLDVTADSAGKSLAPGFIRGWLRRIGDPIMEGSDFWQVNVDAINSSRAATDRR